MNNYERFVRTVKQVTKKHIPRGYIKRYILGWNRQYEELYKKFPENEDYNTADKLLESLNAIGEQE